MPFYKPLLKQLLTCKHCAGWFILKGQYKTWTANHRLRTGSKRQINYKVRPRLHYRLSINHGLGIKRRLRTVYTKTALKR